MHSRESRFLRDGPPRRMPDRRAAVGLLGVRFCHSRRRYRMSRVFNCICGQELRAETDEAIFRTVKEHATTKHGDKRYSDQDIQSMLRENSYTAGHALDVLVGIALVAVFGGGVLFHG